MSAPIAPSISGRVHSRCAAVLRRQLDRTSALIATLRSRVVEGKAINPAADAAELRQSFDGTIDALADAERSLDHSTSQLLPDGDELVGEAAVQVGPRCECCLEPAVWEVREAGGSSLVCHGHVFTVLSDEVMAVTRI